MPDTSTLARRSAHALGWSWAGAGARAALQFGVQIVLARLLGPEAFGQAAAALLVVGLGWLIAEAGLGSALIHKAELGEHDVGVALGGVLGVSAVVAALVAWLSPLLARLLGDASLQPLVLACAWIIPLQALANLPVCLLQRRLQFKRLQLIQLLSYLLAYAGVGVALAVLGWGAASLLVAFAAHALLVLVIGWSSVRATLRPRLAGGAALWVYAARVTASNLVNWAIESVDRLLISRYWGVAPLGEYSLAGNLARAPVTMLVGAAQPVAFAAAARLQSEHERVARGYLAVLALALLLSVPSFVYLAWHAAPIVGLLYGAPWRGAAAPLAVLCLGVPFFVMLALTGPMLRGVNAVGGETRAQLIALILLALALWLAVGQPLVMAAALVSLATALRAALLYRALSHRLALPAAAWWRAWRGALALAVPVVALSWLCAPLGEGAAALASAVAATGLCGALLRYSCGALLSPELALALRNRVGDSRLACALCAWMRLT